MSLININNLTFAYDSSYHNIFDNVSFQIDTNWKLGFISRNGRGKTTFLKLLAGEYEYKGTITASVDFDYFPFTVGNANLNTIDVLNAIHQDFELWELKRELSRLEMEEEVLDRSFNTLSHGEQTKVLLAGLFLKDNNFLLIDEPTNHLDSAARQAVGRYLSTKKGFILVSHDRMFLDTCVDHVLSINKTNIEIQKGNFSSWWYNRQLQDQYELAENEKLQKDIKKLSAAAKRTENWSHQAEKTKFGVRNSGSKTDKGYIGHKAAKTMKRAKNLENRQQKAIEDKEKLLQNTETAYELALHPLTYHSNRLLELNRITVKYGDKFTCADVNFSINQGDRIALQGINGSGKTSLLKLILGETLVYKGRLTIGSNLTISYVPQDTSFLSGNLSDFARKSGIQESLFKAILRKLDFSRDQLDKDMSDFSAGQKKKVMLAKSLCESAHLYIWDEPLNYIDVISRIQIEELILNYKPTMLMVEHDQAFVAKIATEIVNM